MAASHVEVDSSKLKSKAPLSDVDYFSESYVEARDKFLMAARALGTQANVQCHSLLVKEPDYTMDVAVVKGTSSRGLLVHSSGVHGAEGFAGSAIQTALLHGMYCSGERPEVTCMFVHAVNPYGMAHFRRFNENNVDLNRNALTPDGFKEVLARDPNIAGYEDFKDVLLAERPPSSFFAYFGVWLQSLYHIARYGSRHLKRAMVTGTYQYSNGIFFGGRELQPSHKLLSKFLHDHFGHVPAQEVGWVDVHTGLGPKGVDVLLCSSDNEAEIIQGFPGATVQCSTDTNVSNDSQAAGYELVRGGIKGSGSGSLYQTTFAKSEGTALIATQEFGTVPGIMVIRAMMVENRSFICDFAKHEQWRHFTRDAFYVRTEKWKGSIMVRGKKVFGQLLEVVQKRASKL